MILSRGFLPKISHKDTKGTKITKEEGRGRRQAQRPEIMALPELVEGSREQ
jgi:hypothetical protein